jgi:fatty acid desaturase
MNTSMKKRDYRLTGPEGKLAEAKGLVSAAWYTCPVPRQRLKELMRRTDGPAIRDTLLWFALLAATGVAGGLAWGTWWCLPAFAAYGVLYASASDSRWHECGHGTAFKTRWMNDCVYRLASFMVFREATAWRWSHTRHHTDTLIVGRDPEIAVPRPPIILAVCLKFLAITSTKRELGRIIRHSVGRLTPDDMDYIPESEYPQVFREARVYLLIFAAVIGLAIAAHSLLPLMYVGLPTLYGSWLMVIFGLTQHAGLDEDVLDHRLNCRTVYMNPVFRYLYWNMNYHVEHHMFPLVPYHALPALHQEMRDDIPPAYRGLIETYREIIPALLRQAKDPTFYVKRPLPPARSPQPHRAGASTTATAEGEHA